MVFVDRCPKGRPAPAFVGKRAVIKRHLINIRVVLIFQLLIEVFKFQRFYANFLNNFILLCYKGINYCFFPYMYNNDI